MSVVIIGGHDRMQGRYKEICRRRGYKAKVFTQCPASFRNQIGTPDMMIIFTNTVSHKMVQTAIRAVQNNTEVRYCHSAGVCALEEVLCQA